MSDMSILTTEGDWHDDSTLVNTNKSTPHISNNDQTNQRDRMIWSKEPTKTFTEPKHDQLKMKPKYYGHMSMGVNNLHLRRLLHSIPSLSIISSFPNKKSIKKT